VRASPLLEALLAPALLPRGWWNQRALLALKEVRARLYLSAVGVERIRLLVCV
jgi:hypothetical protein